MFLDNKVIYSVLRQKLVRFIFYLAITNLFQCIPIYGFSQQKKNQDVDTASITNWPIVWGEGLVTANGQFACYYVNQSLATPFLFPNKAYIKGLNLKWSLSIDSVKEKSFVFTSDSKFAIYEKSDKSLCIQKLGIKNLQPTKIKNVSSKEIVKWKDGEYLLYKTKVNDQLNCRQIETHKTFSLPNVVEYKTLPRNNQLLAICRRKGGYMLILFDVRNGVIKELYWNHNLIQNLISANGSGRFAVTCEKSVILYDNDNEQTNEIKPKAPKSLSEFLFDKAERFESNGGLILLRYSLPLSPLNKSINPVKIYSYQDADFLTVKMDYERSQESYIAALDVVSGKVSRIEQKNERVVAFSNDGKFALNTFMDNRSGESYWNRIAVPIYILLDLQTGLRRILKDDFCSFSPDSKYLLKMRKSDHNLISENLITVHEIDLAKSITFRDTLGEEPIHNISQNIFFVGWLASGNWAICYDKYDIWLLNISGLLPPINLTLGQGRRTQTVFRLIDPAHTNLIKLNDNLVITGFNSKTKENGFYNINAGRNCALKTLLSGPFFFWDSDIHRGPFIGSKPVKSKNANVWLIQRQSVENAPNWFWTADFKKLIPVSDVYPEKGHNWITSELIEFTTKRGIKTQAILFKPQNFDPNRKYPVLFNYYQTGKSDMLHQYRFPRYTDNYEFNYPMMLSQGYLVCLTDLHQKTIGETAACLVDGIQGAADELSKRPYINDKGFGASGGSYGGYATNCLAALSNNFAALMPISGVSDLFSMYANTPGLAMEEIENRQMAMGKSLATDPLRYLKNSPVAYARSVTTPILIVSTLKDYNVNVQQSNEWFAALRREGKRVWMLQYQENGHGISDENNQKDLFIRMKQFYGHYLKGEPAPVWMTKGLSINDTGVKSGYEYDYETKSPMPSRLLLNN